MKLSSKTYPSILQQIKNKDITLYAYLREGKPYKYQKGILYIKFNDNKEFHMNKCKECKNELDKHFNEIVDSEVSMKFTPNVDLINEIVKMFDGELIRNTNLDVLEE